MTIVAGFVHKDGVLMCGDTEMGDGYSKDQGSKILHIEGSWGIGLAAFSGSVDVAVSAIQKCDAKLKRTKAASILEGLEDLLAEQYRKHVLKHPRCGKDDGPSYDLLIALKPKRKPPGLYVTSETTIHKVISLHRQRRRFGHAPSAPVRPRKHG